MIKHVEPDKTLVKMPSLRAVRSFVAAAKYQNFTRAAESLCVTQAAISRQIRELEAHLEVPLFSRVGSAVELTEAGIIFYDACYLSFVNIAQAAHRIQTNVVAKTSLTICCSHAFSALWLSRHLPDFFQNHPEIDINIVATGDFLHMEPGVKPDVFINKVADPRPGHRSIPLFSDLIYPVCTPKYLADHPHITSLEGLQESVLLNLSPVGRSQIAEHVDWGVWLACHQAELISSKKSPSHGFNANDYNMLIQMVLNHQGVCLGWHHLVAPLIEEGLLIKPIDSEIFFKEKRHFLSYDALKENDEVLIVFKQWLFGLFANSPIAIT